MTTFLHDIPMNAHKDAYQVFEKLGLPTKKVENWHYTDLKKILLGKSYTTQAGIGAVPPPYVLGDTPCIIITNGGVGDVPNLPDGVTVTVDTTLDKNSDTHTQQDHAMVALNTAHYTQAITVVISQNMKNPLHLAYVHGGDGVVTFPRLQLLVKSGVTAEIIESFQMQSGDVLVNAVTEITIEQDAKLSHYKLQQDTGISHHVAFTRAHVAQKGVYNHIFVCLNTVLSRNEVYVDLNGAQANTDIRGIYITDATQKVDNTVCVRHMAEGCESSQLFKGILNDCAQGIFQGKIYVDRQAQLTDGYQMHRAILLSRDAEVDCKPELEIYADDVKCSHGASTGEIDTEQVFYLQSRGVDTATARQLLLKAFLIEVLQDIKNETLRDFLRDMTLERVKHILV